MTTTNEVKSSFFAEKEKYYIALILFFAFALRLLLALLINSPIRSDSYDYQTLGLGLLNGSYSLEGNPTAYVGPGYPFFLSGIYYLFGEGQFFVKIIQSAFETGTCYFFYKVSKNFFDIKFSIISLLIFSFLPSNVIFSQAILSESLFGFFSIVVFYLILQKGFIKNKALILFTGMLFGYAVLIRTSYMLSLFLIMIYFFYEYKKLKKESLLSAGFAGMIFLSGFILILAPWCIRNKIQVGTFSPGTTAGVNFWAGSNPNSTGTYYRELGSSLPLDYHNEAVRDKEYFKLGLKYAMENPSKYFLLGVKKIGYLYSSERMAVTYFSELFPGETSTQQYKRSNLFFLLIVNIPYFAVMLSGTWGLLSINKHRFSLYGFILTWMITIFLFIGLARYHYVLIPFFIIGSVNFISQRKNFFKNISSVQKIAGVCFNIFLLSVWSAEFFMMIR